MTRRSITYLTILIALSIISYLYLRPPDKPTAVESAPTLNESLLDRSKAGVVFKVNKGELENYYILVGGYENFESASGFSPDALFKIKKGINDVSVHINFEPYDDDEVDIHARLYRIRSNNSKLNSSEILHETGHRIRIGSLTEIGDAEIVYGKNHQNVRRTYATGFEHPAFKQEAYPNSMGFLKDKVYYIFVSKTIEELNDQVTISRGSPL